MAIVHPPLIKQLKLKNTQQDHYLGFSIHSGLARVFGGQIVGQALTAAQCSVENRFCHSLHGYFYRWGDPTQPVSYQVKRIRDGKSFSTRRVAALQDGEEIFGMNCSFHSEETGFSHQVSMPEVPMPDECYTEQHYLEGIGSKMPEDVSDLAKYRSIELRRVEPISYVHPERCPPMQHVWLRSREQLPDDLAIHQSILAYASDIGILSTAYLPLGKSFLTGLATASLDHSVWFHKPFRVNEWLLYAQDSPIASSARGFSRGHLFTQSGELVASVAQEGMIRDSE